MQNDLKTVFARMHGEAIQCTFCSSSREVRHYPQHKPITAPAGCETLDWALQRLLNGTLYGTIEVVILNTATAMENTLTAGELKRRGATAIEEGLKRGPVHILKRNRLAGVVLSEDEYQRLVADQRASVPGQTAMQWLLDHPGVGHLTKTQMDQRLRKERDW